VKGSLEKLAPISAGTLGKTRKAFYARLTMLLKRQTGFSSYTRWMDPPAAGIIAEWQKVQKT
jgi:hypothetical protein